MATSDCTYHRTDVFPGEYAVHYENSDGRCTGSPYPCQSNPIIIESVTITADGALDIDLPLIRVAGELTLSGRQRTLSAS